MFEKLIEFHTVAQPSHRAAHRSFWQSMKNFVSISRTEGVYISMSSQKNPN